MAGKLGPVKVAGDLRGGAGAYSGSVDNFNTGSIATVTIGGSVVGGGDATIGILSSTTLGAVTIGGSLRALNPAVAVRITAPGVPNHVGGLSALTVKGSVRSALILADDQMNPDASIGAVTVSGIGSPAPSPPE